ncbi:hypothetical protein [Neisseria bacilliformis]|uniref:hypothetical protein n=1 Tax=Neisseria bacilliformis TaxID=267212 RepID=UPI0006660162|nr:hypothetical protein [Neisseria bacilliformis]
MPKHPPTLPPEVLTESSRQMLQRLTRELEAGTDALWFACPSPYLDAASGRKVSRIILAADVLLLAAWMLPKTPQLFGLLILLSVVAAVFNLFWFGGKMADGTPDLFPKPWDRIPENPFSFRPQHFVRLNLANARLQRYHHNKIGETLQLDGHFGLWLPKGGCFVTLTHASAGEKGYLMIPDGADYTEIAAFCRLLCQRLGLRDNLDVGNTLPDGGNVRRDKSAKIAVICIMALLAAVGLAVIAAGISHRRQEITAPDREIRMTQAQLNAQYTCFKDRRTDRTVVCRHRLIAEGRDGELRQIDCLGLEDSLCGREQPARFGPADLRLLSRAGTTYLIEADYRLPETGRTAHLDNRAALPRTPPATAE